VTNQDVFQIMITLPCVNERFVCIIYTNDMKN